MGDFYDKYPLEYNYCISLINLRLINNTMKRIVLFTLLVLASMNVLGQTREEAINAIRQIVMEINKKLPIDFKVATIDKIQIEGSDLCSYYTIDESIIDLDQYASNMKETAPSSLAMGANKEGFSELVVLSELNRKFYIKGAQSGRTKIVFIPAAEVKEAYNLPYATKDFLMEVLLERRKDLSEDWGNGLTLTGIEIEDNYICHRINTDKTVFTIAFLKMNKRENEVEMVNGLIEGFNETKDPILIQLLKYIIKSKMGMKYTYWSDNTAENITFTITPVDMETRVKLKPLY